MMAGVFAVGMEGIPLVDIKEPRDNDVLCGRGGASLKHLGNQMYRRLVHMNKAYYTRCMKSEKLKISRSIVAAVREQRGRFLERDGIKGTWYDIGDKKAIEKTSQALREGQPKLRQEIESGSGTPGISPIAIEQQNAQIQMAQQRLLAQQRVIQQQMAQQRLAQQQAAQQQLIRQQMVARQMALAQQQAQAQAQVQQLSQRAEQLAQQQAQAQLHAEQLEQRQAMLLAQEEALKLAQEEADRLTQEQAQMELEMQRAQEIALEQARLAAAQNHDSMPPPDLHHGNPQGVALHDILMHQLTIAHEKDDNGEADNIPDVNYGMDSSHSGERLPQNNNVSALTLDASGESDFGEYDNNLALHPLPVEGHDQPVHRQDADVPKTIPIFSVPRPDTTMHPGMPHHHNLLEQPIGSFSGGQFSFSGRLKGETSGDAKEGQQPPPQNLHARPPQYGDSSTPFNLDRRRLFARMKFSRPASSGRLNRSNASNASSMDDGMPDVHMVGSTLSLLSNVSSTREMKADDTNSISRSDPRIRDDFALGSRRSLMSGMSRMSTASDAHSMFSDLSRKIGNISTQSMLSEISGIEEGNHEDLEDSFHFDPMIMASAVHMKHDS